MLAELFRSSIARSGCAGGGGVERRIQTRRAAELPTRPGLTKQGLEALARGVEVAGEREEDGAVVRLGPRAEVGAVPAAGRLPMETRGAQCGEEPNPLVLIYDPLTITTNGAGWPLLTE